ncbi:KIF6 [Symbiodinium necroappetens]|uniref:KIF6 protein n=1 Tax=Symbiodinium necroappetens TaxID=1628268 RepID=A0A812V3N6_9DINO|nr:KIF6 [Symbiodinium necroappetens]|mmetsp:Transcript_105799/g.252370  ORF Transcript_105799/g.252370 Transcript_105799/m.252370 type:complete len:187 (+) Transcript_105799:76-636(+)
MMTSMASTSDLGKAEQGEMAAGEGGPHPSAVGAPPLTAPTASVSTLPKAWRVVLNYRRSVMCFAFLNLITIVLGVSFAVNESIRFPGHPSWGTSPVIVLGVVFMLGPLCGFIGASYLRSGLATVYLGFTCLQTASHIVFAVATLWLSAIFLAFIQCWVMMIVSTFCYSLCMVPLENRGQLLELKDR